jgi:hypothetical protein
VPLGAMAPLEMNELTTMIGVGYNELNSCSVEDPTQRPLPLTLNNSGRGGTPAFLTFRKFYLAITCVVLIALVYVLASVKLPNGSCGLSMGSIAAFTPKIK